jgi:hypothetical protein
MSYPAVRKEIAEGLAAKIKETFPEVEVILIPFAVIFGFTADINHW